MRSRPAARTRPTWWVLLAVTLALMALVAATATVGPARSAGHGGARGTGEATRATTTTSAARLMPSGPAATGAGSPALSSGATHSGATVPPASGSSTNLGGTVLTHALAAPTTTTAPAPTPTAPPATTTTAPSAAPSLVSYPGYLQPPTHSSAAYSFTGAGATRISAVWSDTTYLTMAVSCSGFNQSTGGSSALSMSIPDAQGSCLATLTEPGTENATVSYTLTISPSGGG